MKKESVLIVDDDEHFLGETEEILSASGYDVVTATTGREAKKFAETIHPAIALLDKKLPDMDGQDLVRFFNESSMDISCIIVTAHASLDSSIAGFKDGVYDYIIKPAKPEEILKKVKEAIDKKKEEDDKISSIKLWGMLQLKKYETLFEQAGDAVVVVDALNGAIAECNKAALKLTGYEKGDLLSRSFEIICQKRLTGECETARADDTGDAGCASETEVITRRGEKVPCYSVCAPVRVDGNRYYQVVFHDLSELKKRQKERDEAEKKFEAMFSSLRDGLILANIEDKKFAAANRAICEMLQYTEEELKELGVADIHPEKDLPRVMGIFNRQIKGELSLAKDIPVKRKDGTVFYADINPVVISLNGKEYLLGSFRDVTEKRLMEEELRSYGKDMEIKVEKRTAELKNALDSVKEANEKLKRFDERKSQFVANVAHEIGNPLFIIREGISIAEEVLGEKLSGKPKETLDISLKEIDRLINFSKNMLDISKIEAGKMDVKKSRIKVVPVIENVLQQFRPLFDRKKVKTIANLDGVPDEILADESLLRQLLINMISNALKYTPSGRLVGLKAMREENFLRIEMKDEGPGIPESERKKIFDKYHRIFSEQKEGTGLGLPIAREIVALHGGKMWVESDPGKGSTFIVLLPVGV